ncbi:hypothetical protein AU05_06365 [Ectopseudomonas composti]|jgi:hypothetical protein|uniref:Uncharacterized protein n=2 Tax=Ectopseudomonas composti TaxID=658457 RepID=A0ABN0S508_9GAMM|nr:hypothetical protein [Pseudomonas composti]EZH76084.1 hypothetical protein AU05_06365 [Pseudomonas composti]
MEILLKICATLGVCMGTIFALLPGSFGLLNFRNEHGNSWLSHLAASTWWLLVLAHPFALYRLWLGDAYHFQWLLLPVTLHLLFFSLFGRNLSTR